MRLFPLHTSTLPPSQTLPWTGLPDTGPTDLGRGRLTEMCRLGFKVTHASPYRTILPPAPRLSHRGGVWAPRAATAPSHRGTEGATSTSPLGGSLRAVRTDGEGWQCSLLPYRLPQHLSGPVGEGVSFLEGLWLLCWDSSSRYSGLSGRCWGHGVGEGPECPMQVGRHVSVQGSWVGTEARRSLETSPYCPSGSPERGERG